MNYQNGKSVKQRDMPVSGGMSHADTAPLINYFPPNLMVGSGGIVIQPRPTPATGTVNMKLYLEWLRKNGYNLGNLKVQ